MKGEAAPAPYTSVMPEWNDIVRQCLQDLRDADPRYKPTNFWGPGVDQLLRDLDERGMDRFKDWPTAAFWFYPSYGSGFNNAEMAALHETVADRRSAQKRATPNQPWFTMSLSGTREAMRDHDVACAAWDQDNWPFDLTSFGESRVGRPRQAYPLIPEDRAVTFGRGYLNYLLCLAALSRHVPSPPTSFLEIGGGFGVLGEILLSRDPSIRYLDIDIPPLVNVASWYLTELFGPDRVTCYGVDDIPDGPIRMSTSGVLPTWRLPDVADDFEVFVNSFSFQEMEPDVVEHYVDLVCARGLRYAVSLNSREGKPRAARPGDHGVLDPVTSDRIVEMFVRHGFRAVAQHDAPFVRSAGRLVVMARG